MPPRALIAGLGLIGGSIALALRARGWRVSYDDPFVDADFERGSALDADFVILATPVDAALELLRELPDDALITSVCSVMTPLREIADQRRLQFVAGHPMAGSEQRGFAAADPRLFTGKRWFVERDEELVRRMIGDCGAVADIVDPREHDEAVALTSHLPQVLSTALASLVDDDHLRFAGSGLKTFLRLAGSDAEVWRPILEANRGNVTRHAEALAERVRELLANDPTATFQQAQTTAKKLP